MDYVHAILVLSVVCGGFSVLLITIAMPAWLAFSAKQYVGAFGMLVFSVSLASNVYLTVWGIGRVDMEYTAFHATCAVVSFLLCLIGAFEINAALGNRR
jgi:hypothetical protein